MATPLQNEGKGEQPGMNMSSRRTDKKHGRVICLHFESTLSPPLYLLLTNPQRFSLRVISRVFQFLTTDRHNDALHDPPLREDK